MVRRKETQGEKQARAVVNSRKRGSHRDKDRVKDDNKPTDDTIELRERALLIYKVQEGVKEEDYLRKGRAAPDLATVKDRIRYYIDSSTV